MLKAELSMKIKVETFGGAFGFLLSDSSVSGRLASFLGLTGLLIRAAPPQISSSLHACLHSEKMLSFVSDN
jgi:hypothetical protein